MSKVYAKSIKRDESYKKRFEYPISRVLGTGGAGTNSVRRLHNLGIKGVETIVVNTDSRHLENAVADKKVLIGKNLTRGLGTGGKPDLGEQCAEQARDVFEELLEGTDMLFITCGLGGGTGTGIAPVIAEVGRKIGAVVVAMATTPFKAERLRLEIAQQGLEKLRKHADTVIILDNNRLLNIVPDFPVERAFSLMDQLIAGVITSIIEIITEPSLVNLDFADVRAILCHGGTSTILFGEGPSNEPDKVVVETLSNPLLDIDYTGANGALIHLTVDPYLQLRNADKIVWGLTSQLDSSANVIYGINISHELENTVKVLTIITGVHMPSSLEVGKQTVNEDAFSKNLDIVSIK
jgi:cell division protein FtsZ